MSVSNARPLFLSDGTPVTFVKVTSRGRYQVKLPDGHPFADGQENGRIFNLDGSHYKNQTDLRLTNDVPATAAATVAPGPVDPNLPMFLSDGTPVTFSKTTRRGNVQVRLPDNHPEAEGQDNGLLYSLATGARYKNRSELFLTNTGTVSVSALGGEATAISGNVTYQVVSAGSVIADDIDSFEAAEAAAFDALSATVRSVQIVKVSSDVVAVVGVTSTRT